MVVGIILINLITVSKIDRTAVICFNFGSSGDTICSAGNTASNCSNTKNAAAYCSEIAAAIASGNKISVVVNKMSDR